MPKPRSSCAALGTRSILRGMLSRRAALLSLTVGIGAGGCTLLTSLDELTNGADAAATDGGGVDAPNEGSPPDGGAGTDGATATDAADAADAADTGAPDPLCTGAVFCDRFERASVQGGWAAAFVNSGGTIDLDTSTFASPVKSVLMNIPTSASARAGLGSNAYLDVAHVRAAFAMKTALPDRHMALFRIQLTTGGTGRVLDLFMTTTGFALEEQGFFDGGTSVDYPVAGFKADQWQRWTIELDATVSPPVGVLTLDGVEEVRAPLISGFVQGTLNITVGSFFAPTGPARVVWYDDVSITLVP